MTHGLYTAQDADPFDPLAGTLQRMEGLPLKKAVDGAQQFVDAVTRLGDAINASIPAEKINISILALDLGTKTGFALRRRDGSMVHGTEDFTPRASWRPGQRALRWRSWLGELLAKEQPQQIAYEVVHRHNGVDAAHLYGLLEGLLWMAADSRNVSVMQFGVGQVKKHWTGAGNADKDAMIAQAKVRGFRVVDDNNADALAILHLAVAKEQGAWHPTPPKPKPRKKRVTVLGQSTKAKRASDQGALL